jgi:aryl-alcohol dehydrogenase-like predicted oxidoreductase
MGMSPAIYGPVDDAQSIRTLGRSLDLGMTFLDTAKLRSLFKNAAVDIG